jgi:catechol 2,3-dioxygenase
MAIPGLTNDQRRGSHHRLQHVALELPTVDDILAIYARLKGLGIEPILTAHHRASTAFYYEDPDRNSVDLTVDNFGDWEKSSAYMRKALEFGANPPGGLRRSEKMIAARAAGMAIEELHKRGQWAG